MAIGISISPVGYNVDTSGKAYTLNPEPLLHAQEKAFQTQNETMAMVRATAQKGVDFAEYLGARQQLGRVKAQLADIDPADPQFTQKYSQIVINNPLAFTNPKVAPVTKLAITPLISRAQQAYQDQGALQRAQVMAGIHAGQVNQGFERSKALWDYKGEHPHPGSGRGTFRDPGGDIFGTSAVTDTPKGPGVALPRGAAVNGAPAGTEDLPDLGPGGGADPNNELLNGHDPAGRDPVFSEDIQQVDGQGDGPSPGDTADVTDTPAPTLPRSMRNTQELGKVQFTKTAAGRTEVANAEPVTKPKDPAQQGFAWITDTQNNAGETTSWKQVPIADEAAKVQKAIDENVSKQVSLNPAIMDLEAKASAAEAYVKSFTQQMSGLGDDADGSPEKAKLLPKYNAAVEAANAAKTVAVQQRATLEDLVRQKVDPAYGVTKAAEELAAQKARAEDLYSAGAIPYGPPDIGKPSQYATSGRFDQESDKAQEIFNTPEKIKATVNVPASEQLRAQAAPVQNEAKNKVWTEEKTFALNEAKKLASELGITEDALLNAVISKDQKSLDAITRAVGEKGIKTPLLSNAAQGPLQKVSAPRTWAASKAPTGVGRANYLDVLRAAVRDPDVYKGETTGETSTKKSWKATPFVNK